MRIRFIILLFLCITNSPVVGHAQNFTLPEYSLKRDTLLNRGVDLLVEFELLQHGINYIPENDDECYNYRTPYLFWIIDGNYYKQKFTECDKFSEMVLSNHDLLNLILENPITLKNSKLLPVRSNNITEIHISHDNEWIFKIHYDGESYEKVISEFDLNTRMINDHEPNINFEDNQKSILNKLIDLTLTETD